jgi:hypothetical protein
MTDQLVGERPRASRGFRASIRATFFAGLAIASFMAATPRDTAVIVNSGSTNSIGYKIQVWSDGSAAITTQNGSNSPAAAKTFTVSAATTSRFFADLAAARKDDAKSVPCMKSASFGTSTHVTWQGWVSPDLDCPPKGSLGAALVEDIQTIRQASGISAFPLRRTPLEMTSPSPPRADS